MELYLALTGLFGIMMGMAYAVFMLYFFLGWKRLKGRDLPDETQADLTVTVVVSARNEEDNILPLLQDLARQDYPETLFSAIFVDDGSVDLTYEVAHEFISRHNLKHFKIIRNGETDMGGSKKRALQRGIAEAPGEIILTTDADCRLSPRWISSMVTPFRQEEVQMAAGPVAYMDYGSFLTRFQSIEFLGLVASGAGAIGAGQPFLCNGASLAYRKSAFLQVKGYEGNEQYLSGDDVFLMHKIKRSYGHHSVQFVKDSAAIVRTRPVNGLLPFLRQRARWASKSSGYRDALSVVTAVLVFLMCFVMVTMAAAGCFNPWFLMGFALLTVLKSLADLPLLYGITSFTGDRALLRWLLPFEAIYPFYGVIAAVLGLFRRGKW